MYPPRPTYNSSSSTSDRKIIERNRRNQMKTLYSELNSLLPRHPSPSKARNKHAMPLTDQLDEAANYIRNLQANAEELKKKRDRIMGVSEVRNDKSSSKYGGSSSSFQPQIEVHDLGSAMEVVLISGLDCNFMFNEIIRVIYEEGLEVVNASFSVVNGTVFHTIRSKVEVGMEFAVARVGERLKKFL